MKRKSFFAAILFVVLAILPSTALRAAVDPPVVGILDGAKGQMAVDSTVTVKDEKFYDAGLAPRLIKPYPVKNKISLLINEYSPYFIKANFSANVGVEIKYYNASGSLITVNRTFTVNFNNSLVYVPQQLYRFEGGYDVTVKITSLSASITPDVARLLKIENELQAFPEFVFEQGTDAVKNVTHVSIPSNTTSDVLDVSWEHKDAADLYDLEWTYIDKSAIDAGRYGPSATPDPNLLFRYNTGRVTVNGTSYQIPLLYEGDGVLFYRVRSVQEKSSGARLETNWSSLYTGGLGRFDFDGHEPALNWQSSTSFAEEGKRKSVVQYFDGSLRNRQTVTKDNSSNTAVVAESIYDYQGRPVVQVMPAPTLNSVIGYTKNFNRGLNGNGYSVQDFDSLAEGQASCGFLSAPMLNTSGAAQYYSPNNPLKDSGFHKYIPQSYGFPFTQTEYLPDNTGRISRVSGVGPTFKLGSGHETSYYYGTPDQKELDALFGTEVGDRSHYFKTMVRDANGQYSVSYTDMHGRTVATALAGNLPDSIKLDSLESRNTKLITETLADSSNAQVNGLVMENKKGLLVSKPGMHTFSYQLSPESLQLEGCDSSLICYTCKYDLRIRITDDCGGEKLGGQAFDTLIRNFTIGAIDTTCAEGATGFSISFEKYLPEGSYQVTKQLIISQEALDLYRDSVFLVKNSCRSLEEFIEAQREILRLQEACKPSCAQCREDLGSWEVFWLDYRQRAGIADADTASHKGAAERAYALAVAECDELCGDAGEEKDIRKTMLLDMMPPSGQYANPADTSNKFSIFYTQVLNETTGELTVPNYRRVVQYTDENGREDLVYDEGAGNPVLPTTLSAEAFSTMFKLSWADSLLRFHPEYCKLQKYLEYKTSHQWDEAVSKVETFREAVAKGYLNPTNHSSFTGFNGAGLFDPLATTHGFKSALEAKMNNYRSNPLNKHLWEIATMTGACKEVTPSCTTLVAGHAFDSTRFCIADLDIAWKTFRQAYFDIKRELINQQLNTACASSTPIDTLVHYNFAVRFGDATKLLALNNINLPTTESGANALRDDANATAGSQFTSSCDSYVEHWVESLAPCTQYHPDSIRLVIVPLLKQVCMEGSDFAHPYGASSVKPGSTNTFRSFEEVIRYYNQTHGITDVYNCHPYKIKAPQPYDKQVAFSDKPVVNRPDSCECANISRYHALYQITGNKYASFSAFMQERYQTNISNEALNALLAACQFSGGEGTGEDCNSMPAGTVLPPVFQCNTGAVCADCETVKGYYNEYKAVYGVNLPVADTSGIDSTQYRINLLFEQFMNAKLGFAKSSGEYLAFMGQCGIVEQTDCVTNQALLNAYRTSLYGSVVFGHYRTGYPLSPAPTLQELFQDGVYKMPQRVNQTPPSTTGMTTVATKLPCDLALGYTMEFRVKHPRGSRTFANHDLSFGGPFYATFTQQANGNLTLYQFAENGVHLTTPVVLPFTTGLSEWRVVRCEITKYNYRLYLDGSLIKEMVRDSTKPINVLQNFISFQGDAFAIDYFRYYNSTGKLIFNEEFLGADKRATWLKGEACPVPTANPQTGFTNYYNQQRGTSYSFAQLDSIFKATCGSNLYFEFDTTTVSATQLSDVLRDFKSSKAAPAKGHVDLDMRTLAGTLTPDEGPKGVFDVLGELIGNTVDGTKRQIKESFVSIWNSSAVNRAVGILYLQENEKFRLVLNPGQKVPCQGIVGMRYFQFDAHNTQFRIDFPYNSYIDFGDGIRGEAKRNNVLPRTTFIHFGDHGIDYFGDRYYVGDASANCGVEAIHTYPDTAKKVVTVYHSDRKGIIHLWEGTNNLAYGDPRMLKNLRGYFPQDLTGILWGGGSARMDSSFMNVNRIANYSKIRSIQFATYFSTRLKDWWGNPGSMVANGDLRGVTYIANGQSYVNGDASDIGLHKLMPNASMNFPKLGVIQYTGGTKANFDSIDFRGKAIRNVILSYLNLDSVQIDRMLIELARNTTKDSGQIRTWSIGGYRTAASDSAFNALLARGWRINLKNSEPAPTAFAVSPIRDTASAPIYNELTDYFNGLFGTNLTIVDLSVFFQRKTGKPLSGCFEVADTTVATATELSKLLTEFQQEKLYPAAGYVDLDMRTLAGTLTPAEGPKGVFDVNGNLIANTLDSTDLAVKASYVQIWNSSAANQAVGTLSLLSNGRFRLNLKPGQKAPCQGIVGMRFYEMDVADTAFSGVVPRSSYIDFGDGTKGTIIVGAGIAQTSLSYSDRVGLSSGSFCYTDHYLGDAQPYSGFLVTHTYPSTTMKSVKVYHSESGTIRFGQLENLRGFLPGNLTNVGISNTTSAASLKMDSIRNLSSLNKLQYFFSYVNTFTNSNVSLPNVAQGKDLRSFVFSINAPTYSDWNNPDQYPFYKIFPQRPSDYTKLGYIQLTGISKANFDSASFAFPKLRGIGLSYMGLDSPQVDRMLIELARNTQMDSGVIRTWNIGGYRTTASDSAYNSLVARHWKIGLKNSEYPYDPYVGNYAVDTVTHPVSSEFTDYFNARYGTNLLRQEVDSFYKRRTGAVPDACTLDSSISAPDVLTLCGRAAPVFVMTEPEVIDNCSDSTFFAVSVGTELFRAYTDSVRGYFDSAYIAKCLGALKLESFTVTHQVSEYHHTLYYYDQAGNLLKTVPPAGVRANYAAGFLDSVVVARRNGSLKVPAHELMTQYRHNSLNQVTTQHTPDAGLSAFWYDRLGRLVVSQNAKQKAASGAETGRLYSYTQYDELGRITEVGELGNAGTTAMSAVVSKDVAALSTWLSASAANKGQITTTVYDLAYPGFTGISPTPITQWNLRNRVSYTSITHGNNPAQYNQATFYSYDVHGNVDTLVQDYGVITTGTMNVMNANGHRFKKMVYKYDLISGKVNMMQYQPGMNDQQIHRYMYDAENRLVTVETSVDSLMWEREARYEYYKHGPLARLVLGQNLVQGIDYAYTLQGWLKGVNSLNLNKATDIGHDGDTTYSNGFVAPDQFGFSLNYFGADYQPVNETVAPFPSPFNTLNNTQLRPLYNGNIAGMAESIKTFESGSYFGGLSTLYSYRYDQLNRIKGMRTFTGFNVTGNSWTGAAESDRLLEEYRYDANGNILQLLRNGHQGGGNQRMDSLNYHYYAGTNRLKKVSENVPATRYITSMDLDPQTASTNYTYDEIGNLITDVSESITNIKWTVYGKIAEIERTPTSANNVTKITYTYDASGNRISSVEERQGVSNKEYRWYVRDAQGNTLAVYRDAHPGPVEDVRMNISELYSYGSGRLGYYGYVTELANGPSSIRNTTVFNSRRGSRRYELSNHLGNVLVAISDRKIGLPSGDSSLNIAYSAQALHAQSYYPFGMMMPGRGWQAGGYRYGFNGKENDNEVKGTGNQQDYGMRIYDPRVGRFLSVDPLTRKFPTLTPYQYASNSPISNIDLDGLESLPSTSLNKYGEKQVYEIPSTIYIGEGWPEASTSKVTPNYAKPVTQNMSNKELYRFVTARMLAPGGIRIADDQYLDEKYFEAEQRINYYFSHYATATMAAGPNSDKLTAEIHSSVLNALYSDDNSTSDGAVSMIDRRTSWTGKFNWGKTAIEFGAGALVSNLLKGAASRFASMSNLEVRTWYNQQLRKLNTKVEFTKENAMALSAERNTLKATARLMMKDRKAAAALDKTDPIQPFQHYVEKYTTEGYSGDNLWQKIITGSAKPNAGVNERFNIK